MSTKETILAEIKKIASETGFPPGDRKFKSETGIRDHEWGKYWARWGDALIAAGFKPNTWTQQIPDDELIEKLAELTRELGHFPTSREIRVKSANDQSFPSPAPFRRLGGQQILASRLKAYALKQGYTDVVTLCGTQNDNPEKVKVSISRKKTPTGFVYLMKSGQHYKIGRTISLGSRERQLSIQIPIPPKTIHHIETDDPAGVESYWHRRFENKRGQGEWFDLSPEDVQAFKRWKKLV